MQMARIFRSMLIICLFFLKCTLSINSNANTADESTCSETPEGEINNVCRRCFANEPPVCHGRPVTYPRRDFVPTLEMSNWISAELVGSLFRVLASEVLGFEVRSITRSDYLSPYARVASGNVTVMFETWDEQMDEEKFFHTVTEPKVKNMYLGTTGVESIYFPHYVDKSALQFQGSHYSFTDVRKLEDRVGPFVRAGTTSCRDMQVSSSKPERCPIQYYDCEKKEYYHEIFVQVYPGYCYAENCGSTDDCRLNGYYRDRTAEESCELECQRSVFCSAYSWEEQGRCHIYAHHNATTPEGWKSAPYERTDVSEEKNDRLARGIGFTSCRVKKNDPECTPETFDLPCSLHEQSWKEGSWCQYDGMWCPTSCRDNPHECLEVMMVTPAWAPGWFESMAEQLQLPFCFVYFGYTSFMRVMGQRHGNKTQFLHFWYYPDALLVRYPAHKIDFPVFDEECKAGDFQDPEVSRITCAFEAQTLGKLLHKEIADLSDTYPSDQLYKDYYDLHGLWQKFEITEDRYDWMLSRHTTAGGENDTMSIVCDFLEQYDHIWCEWVSDSLENIIYTDLNDSAKQQNNTLLLVLIFGGTSILLAVIAIFLSFKVFTTRVTHEMEIQKGSVTSSNLLEGDSEQAECKRNPSQPASQYTYQEGSLGQVHMQKIDEKFGRHDYQIQMANLSQPELLHCPSSTPLKEFSNYIEPSDPDPVCEAEAVNDENYAYISINDPKYQDYYIDDGEETVISGSRSVSVVREELATIQRIGSEQLERSNFHIPREDIDIDFAGFVGGGNFGAIFTATYSDASVAVKRVKNMKDYLKEGDILFEVSNHPNICRLFGFLTLNTRELPDVPRLSSELGKMAVPSAMTSNFLVMELFKDKSILDVLIQGHVFYMAQKVNICRQISAGLLHLHRKGVIHGDMALRNILIDLARFRVAIADFGLSVREGNKKRSKTISPRWSSPELCVGRILTKASDVYAFGVTCIEMLKNGQIAFPELSTPDVLQAVRNGKRPKINVRWNPEIKKILNGCLADAEKRWTAKMISDAWKQFEQNFAVVGYE